MDKQSGVERRRSPRVELVTFCPVTFDHDGKTYEALMADVSELGAQMIIHSHHENPDLDIDEELHYTIRTPYGDTGCSGKTVWITDHDEGLSWGIAFTTFPENADDPLRNLLDSPF